MIELFANILVTVGILFTFVGSFGVLRFEDVYLRLQASSKSITFGFGFVVIGTALVLGDAGAFGKAVLAIAFQFLTAPLAAMLIARAGLFRGIRMEKVLPGDHSMPPSA